MKTHVAIVLDRSGSMDVIKRETVVAFNSIIGSVRERVTALGQESAVTFVTFANTARLEFFNADVKTLKPLVERDYRPDGMTALFDGVKLAVTTLQNAPDAGLPDTSFLVLVVTDGDENNSKCSPFEIQRLLKETQATDRWSHAFQLPPGTSRAFAAKYGIPLDNVREWEATKKGVQEAVAATNVGINNYFVARSQGKRAVQSFYVQTDLSKVSPQQMKQQLADLSQRFKRFNVDQEAPVREFVVKHTGHDYVIGSAYYMLMKTEKVQPQKQVLIMEKGGAAVWGGPEARDLIGLPRGTEAKVVPGNHSSYDIYVQSTSVNRKLPRGTKVLVDVSQQSSLPPTWDHVTVEAKAAALAAAGAVGRGAI